MRGGAPVYYSCVACKLRGDEFTEGRLSPSLLVVARRQLLGGVPPPAPPPHHHNNHYPDGVVFSPEMETMPSIQYPISHHHHPTALVTTTDDRGKVLMCHQTSYHK